MNATGVTASPAESNGKLLLGIWRDSLHVTCGLTACTPGSAPGPTLGNEYGKTLPFYSTLCYKEIWVSPKIRLMVVLGCLGQMSRGNARTPMDGSAAGVYIEHQVYGGRRGDMPTSFNHRRSQRRARLHLALLDFVPNYGLGQFRHGKSIALSTTLVVVVVDG